MRGPHCYRKCWMVPSMDFFEFECLGVTMPVHRCDDICKLCAKSPHVDSTQRVTQTEVSESEWDSARPAMLKPEAAARKRLNGVLFAMSAAELG